MKETIEMEKAHDGQYKPKSKISKFKIQILLFILTVFTTLIAGALQEGINPLKEPWKMYKGIPFSFTLLGILLSHELSHYFAGRAHHTKATLPYFIPAPSLIGTFGAFIKMKSPIETRKALIDIGASGPIAGFVISVIASIIGLAYSEVIILPRVEGTLSLGDSILFLTLSRLVLGLSPAGHDILLHPVAFAGWIGLFVTSLNLIPIGQLDGGHIAFGLFGGFHRCLSIVLIFVLLIFGLFLWEGWALWAFLLLILGLRHPPVVQWEILDYKRRFIGGLSFFIFVITFIPQPFKVSG